MAGAGLADRGVGQAGKPFAHDGARALQLLGQEQAAAGVWILGPASAGSDAEAAVVGGQRRPSGYAGKVPAGQVRVAVAVVARRRAEVGDVAHRDAQAFSHESRKRLREPRTQREDERSRGHAVARTGLERVQPSAGGGAGAGPSGLDPPARLAKDFDHRLDRAPGPDHPCVVLVERHGHPGHVDHGPASGHLVGVQQVVADAGLVPVLPRVLHEVGPLVADDQVRRGEEHAGKQHVAPAFVPLLPPVYGSLGPLRPEEAVGTVAVAGSDAPCLAPGGRARVGRSVLVQQNDLGAGLLQVKSRPRTEGSCAHDRHVGGLGAADGGGSAARLDGFRGGGTGGSGGLPAGGSGRFRAGQQRSRGRSGRPEEAPAVEPGQKPPWVGAIRTSRIGESAASSDAPGACPFMRRMYDTTSR